MPVEWNKVFPELKVTVNPSGVGYDSDPEIMFAEDYQKFNDALENEAYDLKFKSASVKEGLEFVNTELPDAAVALGRRMAILPGDGAGTGDKLLVHFRNDQGDWGWYVLFEARAGGEI